MSEARISVPLSAAEKQALVRMAEADMRDPRDQARYVLRQEAERRGYLTPAVGCAAEPAIVGGSYGSR